MKTSSTSNNNCNLATISNASNVTNDNLVVNNSTVNSFSVNDTSTMVSNPILSQVDCCGGRAHPFWMYPGLDGFIHPGLAASSF